MGTWRSLYDFALITVSPKGKKSADNDKVADFLKFVKCTYGEMDAPLRTRNMRTVPYAASVMNQVDGDIFVVSKNSTRFPRSASLFASYFGVNLLHVLFICKLIHIDNDKVADYLRNYSLYHILAFIAFIFFYICKVDTYNCFVSVCLIVAIRSRCDRQLRRSHSILQLVARFRASCALIFLVIGTLASCLSAPVFVTWIRKPYSRRYENIVQFFITAKCGFQNCSAIIACS